MQSTRDDRGSTRSTSIDVISHILINAIQKLMVKRKTFNKAYGVKANKGNKGNDVEDIVHRP